MDNPVNRLVLVVLVLTVALSSGCGRDVPGTGAEQLKIGVLNAREGPNSSYGEQNWLGIRLGVEKVNSEGGVHGRHLAVEFRDTESRKEQATLGFRALASDPGIPAILGPLRTDSTIACSAIAEALELPMLSTGSTAPWKGEFNAWTFRDTMQDGQAIPIVMQAIAGRLQPKAAAILYANDDEWAVGGMTAFLDACSQHGIDVVSKQSFRTNDTDFSAQLTTIRAENPDLLLLSALKNDLVNILIKARQLGISSQIVGNAGLADPQVLAAAGEAAEGALTASPYDPADPRKVVIEFVAAYQEATGKAEPPPFFTAYGYDGVIALAAALRSLSPEQLTDRTAVRDALGELRGAEGVTGTISFHGSGDAVKTNIAIVEVQDGRYVRWQ